MPPLRGGMEEVPDGPQPPDGPPLPGNSGKEEEGKRENLIKNVQTLVDTFYQQDANDWLKTCHEEQLNRAFVIIKDHLTYEQFKEEILK